MLHHHPHKPDIENEPIGIALRQLLTQTATGTQEEIRAALIKQGYDVNQSTISRGLRKIGAVKMTNELGQSVYHLPKESAPPTAMRQLHDLIISIEHNESLIVIRTSPGSASLIARVLDHHKPCGILGSVAGDDTILVVPHSIKKISRTMEEIKKILVI